MTEPLKISYQNIRQVYDFLDEHAFKVNRDSDIITIWRQFRDFTTLEREKQEAQWEIESFCFSFHGNAIFSFSYSNGTNIGEIRKYPELDEYQQNAFEYLETRIREVKSPLLLARYNHLLWKGISGKNLKYAIGAITNYINSIQVYYQQIISKQQDTSEGQYLIGQWLEKALALGNETKKMIPELREIVNLLLFGQKFISLTTKMGIVEDMLNYTQLFKPEHFKGVLDLYKGVINDRKVSSDDFLFVNNYLPMAIKVAQKLKEDVKPWYEEVGLAHLRIAEKETKDDRNWIKLNEYSEAIEAFRMAGNTKKKKDVEKLYTQLRPSVALDTFELPFDKDIQEKMKKTQEELQQKAQKLLKYHPHDIYATIASANLLPLKANVEAMTKTFHTEFLQFVKTVTFDKNKNISSYEEGGNKNIEYFRSYGLLVGEQFLPFLHYVIVPGIKRGLLTYENLLAYFIQHSWIGRTYTIYDLGNKPEETNWINLISPAIVQYFNQVQAWGESKYYVPNFILCIDSLTLKIEGIFRSLCEKLNISIAVGKKQGMQEVLLNNILDTDELKPFFSEADWLFFEYIFSNKGGLNMRNNIAHSFYTEHEYGHDMMLLLIAVLLKLSAINIPDQ
jgi:hypothetical protein